jgi:hypothetical protein
MKQMLLIGEEKVNEAIDWEIFRKPLEKSVRNADYSKGGRPPKDVILMFKVIMLQEWYHLSCNQLEFQINDRFSFHRFLGLEIGEKVPDENTFWVFREALAKDELERKLFDWQPLKTLFLSLRKSLKPHKYLIEFARKRFFRGCRFIKT